MNQHLKRKHTPNEEDDDDDNFGKEKKDCGENFVNGIGIGDKDVFVDIQKDLSDFPYLTKSEFECFLWVNWWGYALCKWKEISNERVDKGRYVERILYNNVWFVYDLEEEL